MTQLRIATRKSPLALWQTEHVAALLKAAYPDLQVELIPMSTRGDQVLDRSLAAIGGKGLFLKELELAMLRGEADCAVHSLKDVPMELDPPFTLAAILKRAESADAFVSNHYETLADLPLNARVGTSSLRRQAQLRALRPDLVIQDLRGNVNTRLAKLDQGDYDAIILACAGLQRLGFDQRIRSVLNAPQWLPAPAQGAIAIECHRDDARTRELCAVLNDRQTKLQVETERAMNRALGGSCHVPVAALATQQQEEMYLQGMVGNAETGQLVRDQATLRCTSSAEAEQLGQQLAHKLLADGADQILRNYAE